MVVEIVMVLTPKNPLPDQPNLERKQCVGWCIMRLFTGGQTIGSTNDKQDVNQKR